MPPAETENAKALPSESGELLVGMTGVPGGGHARRNGRATELLREILTMSESFAVRMQDELTVNPTDLKAMEHLIMSGGLSPTDLARRLGVSTAAVTAVIDRLTALGHASRTQHPTDRRGLIVQPTPASAERALAMIMPMVADIDGVLDGFSAEEQMVITVYLDRVAAVYQRHLPQGDTAGGR